MTANLLTGQPDENNQLLNMIFAATQGRTPFFDPNAVPNRNVNPMLQLPNVYRQTRTDEGFSTPRQMDLAAFFTTPEAWSYTSNPMLFGSLPSAGYAITPGAKDRSTTTPYTK